VVRRGFGLGVEAVVALVFGATLVPLLFAPLSRALAQDRAPSAEGSDASDASSSDAAPATAPWLAFGARVVVAVALALAVIFS